MSKKGAKSSSKEVSSYGTRDIVLGKVRGYPPWPGMVVDPDSVPSVVYKERPSSKKAAFYCVQFFPTGDYAWLVSKDISKLQTHEIESYINEPYKKSGELLSGYRVALDPRKWELDREAAIAEAEAAAASAEVDELMPSEHEDIDVDPGEKKGKSRKRKRESDAASASIKGRKSSAKKEREPKKRPGKRKNGNKSKDMVESEDEGGAEAEGEAEAEAEGEADEDVGPSKKASPPPVKKVKRDKEEEADDVLGNDPEAGRVRDWRHKLQKAFLSKTVPADKDIPNLDHLFSIVESYEHMSVPYLQFSKIGKVMRHIAVLTDDKVPGDDKYRFRDRAKALVDKWHGVLNAGKPGTGEKEANGDTGSAVAAWGGREEKLKDEKAMDGMKNSNSNPGANGDVNPPVDAALEAEGDADAVGDESVLADVSMSEAGM